MPTPELAKQLSDLGGFALFLLVIVVAAVGLYRQWIVLGWLYRERMAELTAARLEAADLRKAVDRLTLQLSRERARRAGDPPHA